LYNKEGKKKLEEQLKYSGGAHDTVSHMRSYRFSAHPPVMLAEHRPNLLDGLSPV